MRKIFSGTSQYIYGPATPQIHSGPGKVFSIIATTTSAAPLTFSLADKAGATGALLFGAVISAATPLVIHFPQNTPLTFVRGLAATVLANTYIFLITEAEA